LFLLFGLLSPACLNVGMGMQKWGVEGFARWRQVLRDRAVTRRLGVWSAGTLITCCSMGFGFLALGQGGSASTLGALGGFGVVVLTLFSRFALKERITAQALSGVGVVMVGTSLAGYAGQMSESDSIAGATLVWFMVVYGAGWGVGLGVGRLLGRTALGAISGLLCGSLGGLSMVIMKVITGELIGLFSGTVSLGSVASDGYVYLCFGASVLSMLVLQFAYRLGQALLVATSYQVGLIATPSLFGGVLLGEPVGVLQWVALGATCVGVALITRGQPPATRRG
jgi:drug/metabolite transporter (DMT)-like permease